ncbi:hypothetical protein GZ138_07460 [Staphylococcus aureus]|uniref:hypothetical protein n=1 Tax=Staphylococcus aureus TaxID=1280 RepID=UPI0013A6AF04|nr:hypothetical protein [Staphylococcus aureus]
MQLTGKKINLASNYVSGAQDKEVEKKAIGWHVLFLQAEDGLRAVAPSRELVDVYKRQ